MDEKEPIVVHLDFKNEEDIDNKIWKIHSIYFLNSNKKISLYVNKKVETKKKEENIIFNTSKVLYVINDQLKKEEKQNGHVFFLTQSEQVQSLTNFLENVEKKGTVQLSKTRKPEPIDSIENYSVINNSAEFKAVLAPSKSTHYQEDYDNLEERLKKNGVEVLKNLLPE